MSNLIVTVILVVLVILVVAIVLRVATRPGKRVRPKRSQSTISSASPRDMLSAQWRAVKIAPGLISCDAAGKLAGKVFLSRESPQFPLEGCTEKDCRCKYVHLDDRRDGSDRRFELGELLVSQDEKRQITGRRSGE